VPDVGAHYGRGGFGEAILAALRAAGHDPDAIVVDDLAPVDQFHLRGRDATLELVALAGFEPGMRVLDVGGGIGGPARVLARERRCCVTVLDLTDEFCRVGADLTRRARLDGLVQFRHGDATAMPFDAAAFDGAWTQHATMNIADKTRLYAEIHRVVRPGGVFAFHDILAGPAQPIRFPVPWAREPALSHLSSPDEMRALLRAAGFRERIWRDETAAGHEWLRKRVAAGAGPPRPLGQHLLFGADTPLVFATLLRNFDEDRLRAVMAVLARP
jgi:ubiquinone/menaquinone biosynthesis C-methylase UbiE